MKKDIKKKVTYASLLVALGIIYGDIGTSPLYVLKAIVGERQISELLVYGGVSCVFWTLVFQTSVKYIWLTLKADNEGEGGVFSLYALVRRYGKKLVIPTILGATTLLADGIITPPISVASAVEGLAMVKGLEQIPTVPIVVVILTILFFFQRFGTNKVGAVFGPIMFVWFTMLLILGGSQIMNHLDVLNALNPKYAYDLLVQYPGGFWLLGAVFLATTGAEALYSDLGHCGRENIRISWMFVWFTMLLILGSAQIMNHPQVFNALNPKYAYDLLVQYPGGFWLLGAVFLATTGAEALYSDLGHCGRENIRISWMFVKVCLVVNYLGQAAWLMGHQEQFLLGRNPFFQIMPSWFLLIGINIATLAAIIASQALISGSYTLISEAMNMNFWPRVKVKQPTNFKGQIYIPSVNTMLWIGCIMMILYFKSSTHMEAAYGFSITVTMLMTSVLLAYFMYYRLKWNKFLVLIVFLFFISIEGSFFIANVAKIKERWMFLFFELFIFLVMYIWYKARKVNNELIHFVDLGKHTALIKDLSEDFNIPKFATHLIYLTKANSRTEIEEKVINSIFAKKPKRADVYWFLHLNRTESPYTLSYHVSELIDDKVIKVNLNVGFRVQVRTELFFKQIVQDLVKNRELQLHIRPDGSTRYNAEPDFKFVVFQKFLSVENELSIRSGLLLESYFFLKRMAQKDEAAFGLDKSDVVTEQVPLIVTPVNRVTLSRDL